MSDTKDSEGGPCPLLLEGCSTHPLTEAKKLKRKEYLKEYYNKYNEKHQEKIQETQRIYREKNKENIREYHMFYRCSPVENKLCSICSSTVKSLTMHRKYSLACTLISFWLEENPEHEAIEQLKEICKNNDGSSNLELNDVSQKYINNFKPEIRREFKEYRKIIFHFSSKKIFLQIYYSNVFD